MKNENMIKLFYERYQHLSKEYAIKVRNYERYGLELEDIVQEMNIKVYFSIIGYAKAWGEYRKTGQRKPAPIESWIRNSLVNKVKDYIKKFNISNVSNTDKVSIGNGEDTVDIGYHSTMESEIDFDNKIIVINSVNVLKGLKGDRLECYKKFLQGYSQKELNKLYPKIDTANLINMHSDYLRKKQPKLLDFYNTKFESHVHSED
jgi:DNA-directed RNA polymerase specialized sigma24 family protein